MILKFDTILGGRPRKNAVQALCQCIVWVLTAKGLCLYCKLLRPVMHMSLLALLKSKKNNS